MSPVSRFCLVILPCVIASCVNVGTPEQRREKATRLSHDLQQLSPSVSRAEADKVAVAAIEESAKMSLDFKPLSMPWMNNGLVNSGLRKRGLCYQWRDDLFPHLHRLNLKTLDLHLTSARRATLLEHNGIVVTAKGQRFEDGIVLDPWRKGGRLAWAKVAEDRYPWLPLPRELTPMVLRPLLMPELYPSP
jgi:outer membrane murein-binding lipoprotein Lpp